MTDLVTFLNARLDAAAEEAPNIHRQDCASHSFTKGFDDCEYAPWRCDCGVPARVLADVTAKRAIIKKFERACYQADHDDEDFRDTWDDIASSLEQVLILLVQPFADHADFDPAWKP